jgi:hypothetical protein
MQTFRNRNAAGSNPNTQKTSTRKTEGAVAGTSNFRYVILKWTTKRVRKVVTFYHSTQKHILERNWNLVSSYIKYVLIKPITARTQGTVGTAQTSLKPYPANVENRVSS